MREKIPSDPQAGCASPMECLMENQTGGGGNGTLCDAMLAFVLAVLLSGSQSLPDLAISRFAAAVRFGNLRSQSVNLTLLA